MSTLIGSSGQRAAGSEQPRSRQKWHWLRVGGEVKSALGVAAWNQARLWVRSEVVVLLWGWQCVRAQGQSVNLTALHHSCAHQHID